MAVRRLDIAAGFAEAVEITAETLRNGGIAVFPTETVYGVGAAAGRADALARLRRLKGRGEGKPFQTLVSGLAMAAAETGSVLGPGAERLARRFWPGPLTLVVPAAGGIEVGLRVPDSAFMLAVLDGLGTGVVASSANSAGRPPPLSAAAAAAFAEGADLLADGGSCPVAVASSVVRCVGNGCETLRPGALSEDDILAVFAGTPQSAPAAGEEPPPNPVQSVWKNAPRGASIRS